MYFLPIKILFPYGNKLVDVPYYTTSKPFSKGVVVPLVPFSFLFYFCLCIRSGLFGYGQQNKQTRETNVFIIIAHGNDTMSTGLG